MSIASRVRRLIDRVHDGSVTAAARAAGMPQGTLARIVDGRTADPRAESLGLLARTYGATIDWLVSGTGPEPLILALDSQYLFAEDLQWRALLLSLELPDHIAHVWLQLPSSINSAVHYPRIGYKTGEFKSDAIVNAERAVYRSWTALLEEWIRIDGPEAVVRSMSKADTVDAARVAFAWYPVVLLNKRGKEASALKAGMERLAQEHGLSEDNFRAAPLGSDETLREIAAQRTGRKA